MAPCVVDGGRRRVTRARGPARGKRVELCTRAYSSSRAYVCGAGGAWSVARGVHGRRRGGVHAEQRDVVNEASRARDIEVAAV